MKSLQESLFDSDLATKKTPLEKIIRSYDDNTIRKLPGEEVLDMVKIIMNSGKRYTTPEMKAHPIDLSKQIMVAVRTKLRIGKPIQEVCRYVYFFNHPDPHSLKLPRELEVTYGDNIDSVVVRTAMMDLFVGNIGWDYIGKYDANVDKHWKGFISRIDKFYSGCEFIVLDEHISKDLIKVILKR